MAMLRCATQVTTQVMGPAGPWSGEAAVLCSSLPPASHPTALQIQLENQDDPYPERCTCIPAALDAPFIGSVLSHLGILWQYDDAESYGQMICPRTPHGLSDLLAESLWVFLQHLPRTFDILSGRLVQ